MRSWGKALVSRVELSRAELGRDVLLWAVLATPVGYARVTPPHEPYAGLWLVGSLALLTVAVAARRRYPLAALVVVLCGTLFDGNFVFGVPVLSYLAGLRTARARPAAVVFAAVAVAGTVLNLALLDTASAVWFFAASTLLFAGVFPWLLGRYRRQRSDLVRAGWDRAEALERAQQATADRIRLRERARIAQDMHDSLGHELSLIALRAGALELAAGLAPEHRAAAGELRASVAAATGRLHKIIGLLREDAEPAPVRPSDETVTELVDRARDAGMTVTLIGDTTGTGLVPMTARAVHRVVREGLTNAARYAPGAAVTVRVTSDEDGQVRVSVVNDPPPAGPPPAAGSTGSGLLALRERVRLAGGSLTAGPRGGGFELAARLPPTPTAAPVPVPERVDPTGERDLPAPSAVRLRQARRRVRRSLLVAVTAPALLGTALALVYYPFATVNAVLERAEFDRIEVGQPRSALRDVLPRRQVPAPPEAGPIPAGTDCEYYTDGNFPLAQPAYRLCFTDGRLVGKTLLAN